MVQITKFSFTFPPIFAINVIHDGNSIQRILYPSFSEKVTLQQKVVGGKSIIHIYREKDKTPVLLVDEESDEFANYDFVILSKSINPYPDHGDKWIRHPLLQDSNLPQELDYQKQIVQIVQSWTNSFHFKAKAIEEDKGLRLPQLGALHAVLAHRTVSEEPATVVMPTGTGKTDTMISVYITAQCEKLFVVAPTDALRTQIANKFVNLGVLKKEGLLSENALFPIVGILMHKPKNLSEVDDFFQKCNVVVTTMAIAGQCPREIQDRMSFWCSDLFIDEAHHIAAPTWRNFKNSFDKRKILQFTATPFRNDGKSVGGKIVYNYPLSKAQKDGFFRPIRFDPIIEYNLQKADSIIAEKAVEQLRKDRKKFDHILMARVDSISHAKEIFELYKKYDEFNPVLIHSGLSNSQKEDANNKILSGNAKIVVCVDMFGEGFDLPELKIAAFHEIKKSLPITLQLAGRFIRGRDDLGEPTFIANIADVTVKDELRKLYSQDADWNLLLKQSSETVINNQIDLWEFLKGFTNIPEDIPLQNIRPALSSVIYKTKCTEWDPSNFIEAVSHEGDFEQIYHDINAEKKVLVIVIGRKTPIDWAQIRTIYDLNWELNVLYWNEELNLLFINGSTNEGYYKELAQAVAGDVELVKDNDVFRSFFGVNRLKLQNVGLINQFGKLIKYTMRAGRDIESGLSDIQKGNVRKANVFGVGFEDGKKTSIGCSYKGRIWAHKAGNIEQLIDWCSEVGRKVLDSSIKPDEVLNGTLVSQTISEAPTQKPIWIDWPDEFYISTETSYTFFPEHGYSFQLYEAEINLIGSNDNNEYLFEILSDQISYKLKLIITKSDYQFILEGSKKLLLKYGSKESKIEDFFYKFPPTIFFIDGSTLEGNSFTPLKKRFPPFSKNRIVDWNWEGTNICNESLGLEKRSDSIQYRVIENLKNQDYELIFNDDDSGEIADVFAVKHAKDIIEIELYHCKFSSDPTPGARIDDLYAVCGQAQKSNRWMEKVFEKPDEIFLHLLRREIKRIDAQQPSRIEVGSKDTLETLKTKCRSCPIEMKIYIVQPGLSKFKVSDDQLELLGVTENYLLETYKLPLLVIGSS